MANQSSNVFEFNLYALLGVEKTATTQEIQEAYKQRSVKMHPDSAGNTFGHVARFARLQEAMKVLQDPARRSEYDAYRDQQKPDGSKRKATADEEESCEQAGPSNKRSK